MPMIIAGFWLAWIALSLVLVAWFLLAPKTPEQRRHAEQASGLLAAGLGTVVLIALVFMPLPYGTATAQDTASRSAARETSRIVFESLWDAGIEQRLAVYLLLVSLLVTWTAVLAILHARHGNTVALALLWGVTGLLALAMLGGIFSIGPALCPVVALAFVAALNGSRWTRATRPRHAR